MTQTYPKIDFRYAPRASWTSIARPDDPYKTLVDQNGALLYDYEEDMLRPGVFRFNRVLHFALQTRHPVLKTTQTTEDAASAIVVTQIHYEHAVLTLRAFAHQADEQRSDIVLWHIAPPPDLPDDLITGLWLDIRGNATRFIPRSNAPGQHIMAVPEDTYRASITKYDLIETDNYFRQEEELAHSAKTAMGELFFVSVPQPLQRAAAFDFGPSSGLRCLPFRLRAGEAAEGALIIPQNYTLEALPDLDWARRAHTETRAFWQGVEIQPYRLRIPDADLQDMVTACARNILQAREIKAGLPEFQVGATVYRGVWVVDSYFLVETAFFLGLEDDAKHGIDVLLRRVKPSGAIEGLPRHSKETAIAIAAFVRQCELTDDLERMRSLWPVVQNGMAFIQRLRDEAYALDSAAPEYGLMPKAFGDGGIGGLRAEYTTPFWTLVGLKEAARMAGRLGYAEEAQQYQAMYAALLADLRRHIERDTQTLPDGTPYLPMVMPGSGEHYWLVGQDAPLDDWLTLKPWTALWAFCHAIYPGEVFSPDDPLVQNLCTMLEQIEVEGLPKETGWLVFEALWMYSASFFAHVWLYVGRPHKALDYLYAFANHAAPTRVWREEQGWRHRHFDQIFGDMPHNWGSGEFIRIVRNLIVFERDTTLDILPGVPREWFAPGEVITLERTPTRFGQVKVHVEIDAQGVGSIHVARDLGASRQPEQVRLFLPPDLISTARLGEAPALPHEGQWLVLPPAEQCVVGFSL